MTPSGSQSLPPRRELVEASARLKAELLAMIFGVRALGAADRGALVVDGTVRIYVRSASVGAALPKELNGVPLDLIVTEDLAAQA